MVVTKIDVDPIANWRQAGVTSVLLIVVLKKAKSNKRFHKNIKGLLRQAGNNYKCKPIK